MKGTVHPRRLLLCLVLVPALLAGLGAWQSWRAEQQAERLGAAQQRVERALAEARALPPRASVRVDGRAYVRDLALARLDEQLADTRSAQRLNRFAAVLADSGACLAALVAVLGAVSLAGIAGAARSALRSRRCLLLWFELGRRLLPCLLLAQIGLLALALACAGTFEILGLWRVGQVPVSEGRTQLSVALILLGLLASAWQMLAKISRLRLRPAPALDVIGRRLGEEDAPELWTLLRELAARLDTPAPQHLLVGLCDGFYVTANRVCLRPSGEHLQGRSLYLSLPLLGLLDRAELSAVIAHELAHFAGRDAHYSLRFLPIYQGAASQLAAIEEQEANVFERAALEPARLLAGYFLERFGLAVNHWSRLREFAADRRAAQLAGAPAMASALLRSAADTGVPRTLPARSGARAGQPGGRHPRLPGPVRPGSTGPRGGGTPGPSAGYPPSAGPALHGAGRELRTHLGRDRRPGRSDTTAEPGAGRLVRRPPGVEPSAQRRPARQDL
ncbi:M48 family metallopeptidase [Pseudomonas aeruginosa]|uniref:M48 family metallopeptidase n=1 Tax=Pseudomonas aeruginosa TaxID=287 RepID=UPI0015E7A48F|nr:M48 family metallopeptidase [Pseudomonas aeruginosa]